MKWFKQYFLKHFVSSLVFLIGSGVAVAAYFIPDSQINVKWTIGIVILLLAFIVALTRMVWDLLRDKMLLAIDRRPKYYHAGENALVLRRSNELTVNSLVGVYRVTNEIESIVAIGLVYNQTEKIFQVRILHLVNDPPATPDELFSAADLKQYVVKPHIPQDAITWLQSVGGEIGADDA